MSLTKVVQKQQPRNPIAHVALADTEKHKMDRLKAHLQCDSVSTLT